MEKIEKKSTSIAMGLFKAFFMIAFWPITLIILFLGIIWPHND